MGLFEKLVKEDVVWGGGGEVGDRDEREVNFLEITALYVLVLLLVRLVNALLYLAELRGGQFADDSNLSPYIQAKQTPA